MRVEICLNGRWGAVCADESWDNNDAAVLCRELKLDNNGIWTGLYRTLVSNLFMRTLSVHIMEAVMSTFSPNVCLIIGSQCNLGRYDNIVLGIPSASFRLCSILVPAHCHEKYPRI